MTAGYLKRNDVSDTIRRPNARGVYAVKYFEDADGADLSDIVNDYLLALPDVTKSWSPHLVSTEFGYKGTGGNAVHYCWVTLFASGTVTDTPTG